VADELEQIRCCVYKERKREMNVFCYWKVKVVSFGGVDEKNLQAILSFLDNLGKNFEL